MIFQPLRTLRFLKGDKRCKFYFHFFNKFNYFFNILGLTYQYPYYSKDYYYDYGGYHSVRKEVNISSFFRDLFKKILKSIRKWLF